MNLKVKKWLGTLVCLGLTCVVQAKNVEKPNIIFVLLDDLGKEWISCYGGDNIETPNIDALAASGMMFNNAYSMPQCTPSRACFMTGQYPYRSGWVNHWDSPRWGGGYFDWNKNPSIARVMQGAGYKTAVAGKWQLNDFRIQPDAMEKHGFDEYCMWTGCEGSVDKNHEIVSEQRYWDPYIHTKEGSKTYKGQFGPDIYNQFLLDFIAQNKEKPFFVYYPMVLPHTPFVHTPLDPEASSKLEKHIAMVKYIDFLTGKLIKQLDDQGIRETTMVIFTADNGTSPGITNSVEGRRVRGGKARTTENGVNTPFIVSMPGTVPAGVVSDALVDFSDMLPTFAALGGGTADSQYQYDGVSQKEVFLGKTKESQRDWILAMGSLAARMTDEGVENVYRFRDRVLREERYKLFVGVDRKPEKLVDVVADPDEKTNLLENPEYQPVVKRLMAVIEDQPELDNDPLYERLPANPWDVKATCKSNEHKEVKKVKGDGSARKNKKNQK